MGTLTYVLGDIVIQPWRYLDGNSDPLTGMVTPTDITFTLLRSSGSVMVASGETVTFTEIGTTGDYHINFTPANLGLYNLRLKELKVGTFQRTASFEYSVLAAGAVFTPTFTNAFCAQSDIERWTQLSFSAGSSPTSTQVAAFAESRASEIQGMVAGAGFTVTPATVIADSIEEDMLREANAIAAAADALMAKFMMDTPSGAVEKAVAFLDEYEKRMERFIEYLRTSGTPQSIRTHITSGEVTLPDPVSIEDVAFDIGIKMDDEF